MKCRAVKQVFFLALTAGACACCSTTSQHRLAMRGGGCQIGAGRASSGLIRGECQARRLRAASPTGCPDTPTACCLPLTQPPTHTFALPHLVLVGHLVELVHAARAAVGQHHRASLEHAGGGLQVGKGDMEELCKRARGGGQARTCAKCNVLTCTVQSCGASVHIEGVGEQGGWEGGRKRKAQHARWGASHGAGRGTWRQPCLGDICSIVLVLRVRRWWAGRHGS